MKESSKEWIREWVVAAIMIAVITAVYFALNGKARNGAHYASSNGCIKTIDCAPYFDEDPDAEYEICFELKSTEEGEIRIFQDYNNNARYSTYQTVDASKEYKKYIITVKPKLVNPLSKESQLVFFSLRGEKVRFYIKNLEKKKVGNN